MVDSPRLAANKLAAAFVGGTPDPEVEAALRANLATSNLDKAIRIALRDCGSRMTDPLLGHLVGLLLNESLIDGETSTRCEAYVRTAVRECRERDAQ